MEELNSLNRQAACYNQYADAIIYTQYKMSNADKSERSLIDAVNNQNYSVSTEAHEKLHRLLSPISQKLHDGSCILKVSDRIRVKIMEEICCLKSEKRLTSITDAIQKFKDLDRITYYSNHYGEIAGERIGSVLIAKTAEEKRRKKSTWDLNALLITNRCKSTGRNISAAFMFLAIRNIKPGLCMT
ncbi:MAG: hypothetical protein ACLU99_08030 [Alphaproteobacteria bacterium]